MFMFNFEEKNNIFVFPDVNDITEIIYFFRKLLNFSHFIEYVCFFCMMYWIGYMYWIKCINW